MATYSNILDDVWILQNINKSGGIENSTRSYIEKNMGMKLGGWFGDYVTYMNDKILNCNIINPTNQVYEMVNIPISELTHLFISGFSYIHELNVIKLNLYKKGGKYWYYYDENKPTIEFYDSENNYTRIWAKKDKLHRGNNKPAFISINDIKYYVNNKLYRSDGKPQRITFENNIRHFYYYNKNENVIRIENEKGEYSKFKNGKLHTDDDTPAKVYYQESIKYSEWYRNGILHRENKPAIIGSDGSYCYWRNGRKHRWDGPAVYKNKKYENWVYTCPHHAITDENREKQYKKHLLVSKSYNIKNRDSKINEVLGI